MKTLSIQMLKNDMKRLLMLTRLSAGKLLLLGWLITGAAVGPAYAASPQWLTLVSLTFDDGLTQSPARNILAQHGMHGTFYVNSNLVGSGGTYLTKAELDALYADGNEIGGHTVGHVNLATLSDAAQKTAICNDMQNLVNWGYQVHSFAYPYSSTGPTTQSIVASGCPGVGSYESARAVGGLKTPVECFDCPWAEAIPPGNTYYITSIPSISSTTTLADLQNYVIQAENNGGGWVPLVFHRVCDGCSDLAVSPATLDAFLAWLEVQQAQSVYVRTVHQVMTGDYPAPPQPPQLGPNKLLNPSLEIDANANNQADCWQRDGYGVNSAVWTRVLGAHTGSYAEQLQITGYTSGDRKLLSTLDGGQAFAGCAPTVKPGALYQLSAWYKSTVPAVPILFYLDNTGVWKYWRDGPALAAAANWTQIIFYPGTAPTGAQAISFGIGLEGIGTLITDDYSIAEILDTPPPPDTTPPVISGFAPADGAGVSGTVALTAAATDNVGMQRVEFLINGAVVATDSSNPFAVQWNSTAVANGAVTYSVRATDLAGNQTVSGGNQLSVQNDATAPSVAFLQPPTPSSGAVVSGIVNLSATATDNVAVTRVDFLVNGSVVGTSSAAPYSTNWNSLSNPDGAANLVAMAYDAGGNSKATPAVAVTVSNQAGNLLTNPSLEIDANNDSIADCWQRGGYGSNTFIWTRVSGAAHTGNFAESLQITSRTTGDRKLVPRQDLSSCAPAVTAGKQYKLSGWYKSSTDMQIVMYYRTSAGVWQYWLTSANFAAVDTWSQAGYTTPAVPAGANAISFGLTINKVGTLVTDDYAITVAP